MICCKRSRQIGRKSSEEEYPSVVRTGYAIAYVSIERVKGGTLKLYVEKNLLSGVKM